MNKEAAQKWVDELIFGNHPQTKGDLYDEEGYCGLGVACLVYAQQYDVNVEDVIESGYQNGYLPYVVKEWLDVDDAELEMTVIKMNDDDDASLPNIGVYVRDRYLKDE